MDCLRIFSVLATIMLHVCSVISGLDINTNEWNIFNIYNSGVRWSVPVFVMISGALFLGRNINFDKILKKNVKRIFTACLFWSCVYAIINRIEYGSSLKDTIIQIITGHYHMWFCYMIIGLYLLVPVINGMIASMEKVIYFLLLAFVFSFVMQNLFAFFSYYDESISAVIGAVAWNFQFYFTYGYVSYFVCGYYLSRIDLSKRKRKNIYLIGIIGYLFTTIITRLLSVKEGVTISTFWDNLTVNVMAEAVAVFTLFKYTIGRWKFKGRVTDLIIRLSNDSFGAYLIHALIIEQLNYWGKMNVLVFTNKWFSIPVVSVVVFAVSFVASDLINRSKWLRRRIV